MARESAFIDLSIWQDDDWLDLSSRARYLYLTLLMSQTLNHCGVADWRPGRISALNGDPVETIERAGAEMVASRHLVIDVDTEEVLIRSFIRNDGLMKQPKMASAMANAYRGVASRAIRGVVVHELQRLKEDFPDLPGWKSEKADSLLSLRALKASDYPLGGGPERGTERGPFRGPVRGPVTPSSVQAKGSVKGSVKGCPTPAPASLLLTPSVDSDDSADSSNIPNPTSKPSTSAVAAEEFEKFWEVYPRREGRGRALTAFQGARKKVGLETLMDGVEEYVAWIKRERLEQKFVAHPATWLNGERWADERVESAERAPMKPTTAEDLELPPDGLSPEEYRAWAAGRRTA